MMGVLLESVASTRFLLPHPLAVTDHDRFGRLITCAVMSSSMPLLLTRPRLSRRVKLSPSDPAMGTATRASFEVLS